MPLGSFASRAVRGAGGGGQFFYEGLCCSRATCGLRGRGLAHASHAPRRAGHTQQGDPGVESAGGVRLFLSPRRDQANRKERSPAEVWDLSAGAGRVGDRRSDLFPRDTHTSGSGPRPRARACEHESVGARRHLALNTQTTCQHGFRRLFALEASGETIRTTAWAHGIGKWRQHRGSRGAGGRWRREATSDTARQMGRLEAFGPRWDRDGGGCVLGFCERST